MRVESGRLGQVSLRTLESVAGALDAQLVVDLRWHGAELDRLLGARHSAMHEQLARRFSSLAGWAWHPEVSFSIYGERGVLDILAFHAATGSLLVVEMKTEIADVQALLATRDRRVRLARRIASERGWSARTVSSWVVVADTRTNRRRAAAHSTVLRAVMPADGAAVARWLRQPEGTLHALSFLTEVHGAHLGRRSGAIRRVRTRPPAAA